MKKYILTNILLAASFLLWSLTPSHSNLIPRSLAAPSGGTTVSLRNSECNYTMNVSVRPLLFWIGWNDVGGGRIAGSEEPDGEKGLELLIGSDPVRAPRQINRWGYIAERISGSSAEVVGIMTQSDEQTINQAKANAGQSGKKHAFKAIRSRLNGGEAHSATIQLDLDEDFTYRDAASLLNLIPAEDLSIRQLRIPDGTDPGFLFAMKEMIHDSVERYRSSGELSRIKPRQYVYNASIFSLSIASSKLLDKIAANGHEYQQLIESRFEAHNTATRKTSSFIVTYGTDAQISKIPIRIVYQPRWWFRAELLLEEGAGTAQTARRVGDR